MDKFKNTEQLEKAYKELEKEFTKKSRKVAILEKANGLPNLKIILDGAVEHYEGLFEEMYTLKDHQIELLNKRWEMLKEYIDGFKEYNIEEANMAWILTDKMKELEQEKL